MFALLDEIDFWCLNRRMKFERTEHGEVIPPTDWDVLTMDASAVEPQGYVGDVIANIRDAGMIVEVVGSQITVIKREVPREGNERSDPLATQFFNIGVAPSLELDGFTNISFSVKNSQ